MHGQTRQKKKPPNRRTTIIRKNKQTNKPKQKQKQNKTNKKKTNKKQNKTKQKHKNKSKTKTKTTTTKQNKTTKTKQKNHSRITNLNVCMQHSLFSCTAEQISVQDDLDDCQRDLLTQKRRSIKSIPPTSSWTCFFYKTQSYQAWLIAKGEFI